MSLTHKSKTEVLSPRNAMALDTLAGVRGEMARLYRLGIEREDPVRRNDQVHLCAEGNPSLL